MKLAIFDIDGTLTNSNEIDRICFVEAFRSAFGLSAETTEWSDYTNHTDRGLTREFLRRAWNRDPGEEAIIRHRTAFVSLLQSRMHMLEEIEGARAFVELLPERGWTVRLATGAWSESARLKLERSGFVADLPFACCDAADSREEIVLAAIGAHRPDRIVVFGDGAWDIRTARTLRLPIIGVGREAEAERLREAGALAVIPHYRDRESIFRLMVESAACGNGFTSPTPAGRSA